MASEMGTPPHTQSHYNHRHTARGMYYITGVWGSHRKQGKQLKMLVGFAVAMADHLPRNSLSPNCPQAPLCIDDDDDDACITSNQRSTRTCRSTSPSTCHYGLAPFSVPHNECRCSHYGLAHYIQVSGETAWAQHIGLPQPCGLPHSSNWLVGAGLLVGLSLNYTRDY